MADDPVSNLASPDELVPITGCCCAISSCYCDWPECCGARVKQEICCYTAEFLALKPACECCGDINPQLKAKNARTCCLCFDGSCALVSPNSCAQSTMQLFCYDVRCAIPCCGNADVPCVLALCGIMCCLEWKCACNFCSTIGAAKAKVQDGGAPASVISDDAVVVATVVCDAESVSASPQVGKMEHRE
mmetsp:Transcript_10266/g.12455  ORF Transcript_10266/g.12455 Transcript_10266/m.12455 type:complete len:189 (-) Transcript_10266:189-755(-)